MPRPTHRQRYEIFLAQLREARLCAEITQAEAAKKLANTQTFISKCERGERRLDVVDLLDFLDAYGVSSAEFLAELKGRLRQVGATTRQSATSRVSRKR